MLSDACFAYLDRGDIPTLIRECLHYAGAPFAYGDELVALLAAAREAERDPGKRSALDGLARLVMDFHDSPPDPRTEEMRRAADLLRRELAAAASAALGRPVRFEADAPATASVGAIEPLVHPALVPRDAAPGDLVEIARVAERVRGA